MTDKDKVGAPDDESNVDQINSLITNSKKTEPKSEEEQKNVEVVQTEEKEEAVDIPKAKEQPIVKDVKIEVEHKVENKTEHKKINPVKHIQAVHAITPKKEEKVESDEKKPENHIKNNIKHEIKKEAKPIITEKKEIKPVKHEIKKEIKTETIEKKPEKHIVHEVKKEEKAEPKKEAKQNVVEHIEHKKEIHVKHDAKKAEIHKPAAKSEPKKIVQEIPITKKPAKVIVSKKSIKEENMKNHKEHQKKSQSNKNMFMWIGIGVLAIILVVALIFILTPKKIAPIPTNLTSNSVAATVNGDPIYLSDVKKEYDALDPTLKPMYTLDSILNKSIDDLLLYQEAKNEDIQVTDAEVQAELDNLKIQNQLTDATLQAALAQQGLTLDSAKVLIQKNLLIRKLLNATVLKNITVADSDIEAYYNQNIAQFKVPEMVTVQHILILVTPNVTNETAHAKILQINSELNSTNFCELVTKYSQDPGSISTCGTYTFGRGQMVPEFENPSFNLKIGETTIVQSSYGYHLIKKLDAIPARTLNLSEVKDNISAIVHDQIAQKDFDALLAGLRANATIINYLTKTNSNQTVAATVQNLDDFAKCITEKGAVFYGASWCTHCQNQKTMFGDSLQYVKYVECAGPGNTQTQECTDAGISGYPTWIVNNQTYPGEQTLANLAKLTGCTLPQ